jgi:hypothetical protein
LSNRWGKSRIVAVAALGSLGLAFSGCGSGRPDTFQVTGTVIYRGQPLADAAVMFIPKNARPACGNTDAQGRFTLLSFSPDDGAVIGEHVVCVSKRTHGSKGSEKSMINPDMKLVVPEKYTSPLTSPLRVTVTKNGPNDFRLELKD